MIWLVEQEQVPYIQELLKGSDRACAILGATFCDEKLRETIELTLLNKEHVNELFSAKSELISFNTRIELGFAIGLLGKQCRSDLKKIADIRNKFAHKLSINSFTEPAIKDKCATLWFGTHPEEAGFIGWARRFAGLTDGATEFQEFQDIGSIEKSLPRLQYECTVNALIVGLHFAGPLALERSKLPPINTGILRF